jgi:hypothetical protein
MYDNLQHLQALHVKFFHLFSNLQKFQELRKLHRRYDEKLSRNFCRSTSIADNILEYGSAKKVLSGRF